MLRYSSVGLSLYKLVIPRWKHPYHVKTTFRQLIFFMWWSTFYVADGLDIQITDDPWSIIFHVISYPNMILTFINRTW